MFTHPSLLRSLNKAAEFLRQCGEARWARDLKSAGDSIRRAGWTEESRRRMSALFEGDAGLGRVSFGMEHERWLHGEKGVRLANERLQEICLELRDLAQVPTAQAPGPGPRPKSPDLE